MGWGTTASVSGERGGADIYSSALTGTAGINLSNLDTTGLSASTGTGDIFILGGTGGITLPTGYIDGNIIAGEFSEPGSLLALGLDTSTQTIVTSNFGNIIFFPQAPSLRIIRPPGSFRYRNRLTVRGTSSKPLTSLQAKWTGRSRFKTTQLGGATSWRVKIPRNNLGRKQSVTVHVRGIDELGKTSSIVKRRYRRR